jgi:hypothetical protein
MRRLIQLGCAAGLAAAALLSVAAAAQADDALPYKDDAKVGSITLCDKAGKPLTKGSVDAAPFAWSAHTDVIPPAGYDIDHRTASLFAYQPRQGVAAGSWSGQAMTPASRYDDVKHPTVQFADTDDALDQMTSSYPPLWGGLYELRMYLSAPNQPIYRTHYAAVDIRVSDDLKTWVAVDPGTMSCTVGTATSISTILHLTPTPSVSPTSAPRSAGPSASKHTGAAASANASVAPGQSLVSVAPGQSPVPTTGYVGGLQGFPQSIHPGVVPVNPGGPTAPAETRSSSHPASGGLKIWSVALIAGGVIVAASFLSRLVGFRRRKGA